MPVVYNGPVPDYGGKLAFVSLVWQKAWQVKNFPRKYTGNALPSFERAAKVQLPSAERNVI